MTRIEELEKEIQLTKELIELQKVLIEIGKTKPVNPYPPSAPYVPPYIGTPWHYPNNVWYCSNSST